MAPQRAEEGLSHREKDILTEPLLLIRQQTCVGCLNLPFKLATSAAPYPKRESRSRWHIVG